MRAETIKVLVADDHALVRSGIRRLLEDEQDIEIVGEAETASQALSRVRQEDWDVVIMDIDMPGQSSLDVLRMIKNEKPNLPVLILTMHPEGQYALRSLKDGASGYLTKDCAPDHLVTAVRKIAEGGAYVSPTLALQLAAQLRHRSKETLFELLSDREVTVLCAIAKGSRLQKIAEDLNLSAKTVTTYRRRLLDKLNVESNAELARYALQNGLIS